MRMLWSCAALAVLSLVPAAEAWAPVPEKAAARSFEVPYRLTVPKHLLVRAKINGKGPFNFILDTGAPALFVATDLCRKLGVKPGDRVVTFNGEKVRDGAGLLKLAAALTAGQDVTLTLAQGDRQRDVTVKAGEGL